MEVETVTKTIKLTKLGGFKFKAPFICEVKYDPEEDIICIEHKETMTIGCGGSEQDALNRFEMHIIGFLFGCIVFDEDTMSADSKVVRDNLKKHIDFEKYPRAWLMKEIDVIIPEEGEGENGD